MSIQSEIARIAGNVAEAYAAVSEKGGELPGEQVSGNLADAIRGIPAGGITLESIAITAPPDKTAYIAGEPFDPTGMEVTATYSNGATLVAGGWAAEPAGPLPGGLEVVTVRYTEGGVTVAASQPVTVKEIKIYGVEWDQTSNDRSRGVRTDAAADFPDPSPAVGNGTGSSPFDSLMPWAGMVRETRAGGVEVKEPKYWFKWTKTGRKLKLQIANEPVDGFHVDPVNMDKGDGLGELDFSYIGRYHCTDTYRSETDKAQLASISRSTARTQIHNLGADFWQMDFAQMWYVGMLYLVEFADWDGQATIGYGCSANNSRENNGRTDAMQYHTGTTAASRDTYGFTQYRNIEGWWDNVYDWMDGCYNNSSGMNVILNPNQFNDSENGTLIGSMPTIGYPSDMAIPTQAGFEWALRPATVTQTSGYAYAPDYWGFDWRSPCPRHGGTCNQYRDYGPFYVSCNDTSYTSENIGCRLQERPPKAAS